MVKWNIKHRLLEKEELVQILLKNRGITTQEKKKLFFNPPSPLKINISETGINKREIDKAIIRVISAIKKKESVVIYGDYDADGITATAILWETLHNFSKKTMPYIPHRIDEGYGLSKKGIDTVIKNYKPKIIISVDCGVTAKEEIDYAKKKGVEVIVTDHHVIPKQKPNPFALIHSTKIAGSAVSWFFAREIASKLSSSYSMDEKIGLCAIGTISDILPLTNINRSLVSEGLGQLRKTKRTGLRALFSEAGIVQKEIESFHIAYMIGPRINASGRISHAMNSLRLLCTQSILRASVLARSLNSTNKERQKITQESFNHARAYVVKAYKNSKTKLIFVSDKSYNQGVIGLVAGKLSEEFYRPTVVISIGEIISKASARSISGFNIISTIRQFANLLVDCGGHPMAAGFTVETSKLEIVKKSLQEIVDKNLNGELLKKSITVDCEINLKDLTNSLYQKIIEFKPFGFGNAEPLFATRNLQIVEAHLVGRDGKHLKMRVADREGNKFTAIAFGMSNVYTDLTKDCTIDIVYSLTENNWNGKNIELKIKDIKL